MNKILKFNIFRMLILVLLAGFTGCNGIAPASNELNEAEAIAKVIKNHPEFPSSPNNTLTKELPTGGPSGSTAKVKYFIKAESPEKDIYVITLVKDWGITVNETYVRSFWRYRVSPKETLLEESMDYDYLPDTMK